MPDKYYIIACTNNIIQMQSIEINISKEIQSYLEETPAADAENQTFK